VLASLFRQQSLTLYFDVSLIKGGLPLERLNREIKRRTRVASLFPNAASCLRLVSAILSEQDEEWLEAKIYLNMNP
jgi:transposase-like protein